MKKPYGRPLAKATKKALGLKSYKSVDFLILKADGVHTNEFEMECTVSLGKTRHQDKAEWKRQLALAWGSMCEDLKFKKVEMLLRMKVGIWPQVVDGEYGVIANGKLLP